MRRFPLSILLGCFLLAAAFAIVILSRPVRRTAVQNAANQNLPTNSVIVNANISAANINTQEIVNAAPPVVATPVLVVPMFGFFDRITKKPFGIHITPATSPVQPEKFSGYHTGADAETTTDEQQVDVPVVAIADGIVVFAGHVNGYGGVMLIEHHVNGETVTALYGHLRISSFTKKKGEAVQAGKQIAVLGTGYSNETDGERKHLHFGLIKGASINYKGYIPSASALSAWYDPVAWLTKNGA